MEGLSDADRGYGEPLKQTPDRELKAHPAL
jgi:hypothetical protein